MTHGGITPFASCTQVERRNNALTSRLPKDWVRNRVRLSEADLRVVLQEGTRITKEFYPGNVLARMTGEGQQSFWSVRHLEPKDYVGLTSNLLAETFSQDFLTPLQETDLSFQLKVRKDRLYFSTHFSLFMFQEFLEI